MCMCLHEFMFTMSMQYMQMSLQGTVHAIPYNWSYRGYCEPKNEWLELNQASLQEQLSELS